MHQLPAKFPTENFGVLLFGKHESLTILPLRGRRVSVTREEKFALAAKIPELMIVLSHAFLFRKRHPVEKVLPCRAEDAPVRIRLKRRSIGPVDNFVYPIIIFKRFYSRP